MTVSEFSAFVHTREAVAEAVSRGKLEPDASGHGIACPCCGSGKGQNGTGMSAKKGTDEAHFTCWSGECFTNADLVDLIGYVDNGPGASMKDNLMAAAAFFGVELEFSKGSPSHSAARNSGPQKPPVARSQPAKKPDPDQTQYFRRCAARLADTDYLQSRGISMSTAARFGIGYDPKWRHPKAPPAVPSTPRVIIPTSPTSYLARDTRSAAQTPDEAKKYTKQKAGAMHLFNVEALKGEAPVFLVEGEFDALSVIEAGHEAVALGSVAMASRFIEAIRDAGTAPPILLALDNDKAGRTCKDTLKTELGKLGVVCADVNISGQHKDPNEALVADRSGFTQMLDHAVASLGIPPPERSRPQAEQAESRPQPEQAPEVPGNGARTAPEEPAAGKDQPHARQAADRAESPSYAAQAEKQAPARAAQPAPVKLARDIPPVGKRYVYFTLPADLVKTVQKQLLQLRCPALPVPPSILKLDRSEKPSILVPAAKARQIEGQLLDLDDTYFGKLTEFEALPADQELKLRESVKVSPAAIKGMQAMDRQSGYGIISDEQNRTDEVKRRGRPPKVAAIDKVPVDPGLPEDGQYQVQITRRDTREPETFYYTSLLAARQHASMFVEMANAARAAYARIEIASENGEPVFRRSFKQIENSGLDEQKGQNAARQAKETLVTQGRQEALKEMEKARPKEPLKPRHTGPAWSDPANVPRDEAIVETYMKTTRIAAGEITEPDRLMDFMTFSAQHLLLNARNALSVFAQDPTATCIHSLEGWEVRGRTVREDADMFVVLVDNCGEQTVGNGFDIRDTVPIEGFQQPPAGRRATLDEVLQAAGGEPNRMQGDHAVNAPQVIYSRVSQIFDRTHDTARMVPAAAAFQKQAAAYIAGTVLGIDMRQESARPFTDKLQDPKVIRQCSGSLNDWMRNLNEAKSAAAQMVSSVRDTINRTRRDQSRAQHQPEERQEQKQHKETGVRQNQGAVR